MNPSQQLANYYDSIVEQCNRDPAARPNNLPHHDQVIYYVISTRCEIDMNGFDSVFDQLLTENELRFLIDALNELKATELAELFRRAHTRLQSAGFFEGDSLMVCDLENDEAGFLDDIEAEMQANDALWDLDDRLAALIPPNAE